MVHQDEMVATVHEGIKKSVDNNLDHEMQQLLSGKELGKSIKTYAIGCNRWTFVLKTILHLDLNE